MKNIYKLSMFFCLFMLCTSVSFAQNIISGKIVDATTNETLPGVTISLKGTTIGTVSNTNGDFQLKTTTTGEQILLINFMGYITEEIPVNVSKASSVKTIALKSDNVGIEEVMVIASVATDRHTPIAASTISPLIIEEKLGNQEFPEILKLSPSVYATKGGGGYGEARINLRGFDSRNVAVLINGVPVNDMENGKVYWSNWAGLADVTRSMQVQRGLGASKVAVPSVGGTINILTKTTDVEKGGNAFVSTGNDMYQKAGFTLSTGLNENGLAITTSFSHTKGNGYVDGTGFEAWSYFLNVSKAITNHHRLSFSVFGAPQKHKQRYDDMAINKYRDSPSGRKYNSVWGYKDGEVFSLRTNFYHKPQAILNHFWDINQKTTLSTALYASIGTGGGTGPIGDNDSKFYTYKKNGQINFDRIVSENEQRGEQGADAILRASRNNHKWYGILTNFSHATDNGLTFSGGLDMRYYKGEHYREVVDLMGGNFYLETHDKNNPSKIAKTGDKIAYHNDGIVGWYGLFGQVEYQIEKLSTFAAISASNMSNKRVDYFNYTPKEGQESDKVSFNAWGAKAGANYNLTDIHNVFANIGYFERQPDFDAIFRNYVNDINPDAENEKITSYELGYGLRTKLISANINLYNTKWADKSLTKDVKKVVPDPSNPDETITENFTANLLGVDALHKGIEIDFELKPLHRLTIRGMASIGDWKWLNNLEDQKIFDDNNIEVDAVDLYLKDVKVGDAAQTTASIGVSYLLINNLNVGFDFLHTSNLYAEFDPIGDAYEAIPENGNAIQPWKIPSFNTIDCSVRYTFDLKGFDAVLGGKINNLLDAEYISEATDGDTHNWDSARVYYGFGRTWSISLKINF